MAQKGWAAPARFLPPSLLQYDDARLHEFEDSAQPVFVDFYAIGLRKHFREGEDVLAHEPEVAEKLQPQYVSICTFVPVKQVN
jgi:hypothetical protein